MAGSGSWECCEELLRPSVLSQGVQDYPELGNVKVSHALLRFGGFLTGNENSDLCP